MGCAMLGLVSGFVGSLFRRSPVSYSLVWALFWAWFVHRLCKQGGRELVDAVAPWVLRGIGETTKELTEMRLADAPSVSRHDPTRRSPRL
jgi:hypothetical protein